MFSTLTSQMSQVSSWIGSKKGEDDPSKNEEKVPTPTAEGDGAPAIDAHSDGRAGGSKLEMLSNVKGQMSSWIGSVQVPSVPSIFSKGDASAAGDATGDLKVDSPTSGESVKGSPEQNAEDDNSSRNLLDSTNEALNKVAAPVKEFVSTQWAVLRQRATGGADSDAVPEEEEATTEEGKDGAIGGVSTKAVAGAKTLGSFLFSAVNKAGETVSKAGAKIKKTVGENALLADFNKEQEAFINEKDGSGTDAAVPPWVGVPNEEALKEECLSLSTDRRNFVRSPPPGVEFPFDYETCYKVALATLAEDPNLEKMRFDLVPKVAPSWFADYHRGIRSLDLQRVISIAWCNRMLRSDRDNSLQVEAAVSRESADNRVSEENFWRNYFYRVSLLRQQAELNAMEPGQPSRTFSVDGDTNEEEWERELEAELKDYEVVADRTDDVDADHITEDDLEDLK